MSGTSIIAQIFVPLIRDNAWKFSRCESFLSERKVHKMNYCFYFLLNGLTIILSSNVLSSGVKMSSKISCTLPLTGKHGWRRH